MDELKPPPSKCPTAKSDFTARQFASSLKAIFGVYRSPAVWFDFATADSMIPMNERSSVVPERTSLLFYSGVTLLSFAAVKLGSLAHFMAALLVGGAGFIWYLQAARNPARAQRKSEDAYLLGYIGTIAGLGAVAFRISLDASLLETANLPKVLRDGSLALLSTVIGLIAMNLIKTRGYSHEVHREEQESEFFEAMLARVLPGVTKELNSAIERTTAERDAQLLTALQSTEVASQLRDTAKGLTGLNRTLSSAGSTLERVLGEQTASVQECSSAFAQQASLLEANAAVVLRLTTALQATAETVPNLDRMLAGARDAFQGLAGIAPSASAVVEQLTSTTRSVEALQSQVTQTTAVLGGFSSQIEKAQKAAAASESALDGFGERIHSAVKQLESRVAELQPYSAAVHGLVDVLNQVAPTLKAVAESSGDIGHLRDNLKATLDYLHGFNEQLTSSGKSATELGDAVGALQGKIDLLVNSMAVQAFELTRLAKPLTELGQLAAGLGDVRPGIEQLAQFAAQVGVISERFATLDAGVAEAGARLKDVADVITNYVEVTSRAFEEHVLKSRR